ncbi:MAG TPA: homogentisate 1,2-dioxygenase [Acidimicrobiia bacterium]|nr:homogentisate 1,2-dioxygenase [Acidimicrobiia bacterium]
MPRKRHTLAPDDAGGYLAEELLGLEGFAQESSLLYHRHSPSAIVAADAVAEPTPRAVTSDHPLQPRHLRTSKLGPGTDAVLGRVVIMGNDNVTIAWCAATRDSELYRNALGDELVYVQQGTALLETSFGTLAVGKGDYVHIPCATTHRWRVHEPPLEALILEARGHVRVPRKYVTDRGQLREGAPYSERDLRPPDGPLVCEGEDVAVLVRNRGGLTQLVHAHHPLDVVAWDGCAWPFAFSIYDFEPVVGARHQPPPVHQTFEGDGFVVCSFVPRPFDFGVDAVKIPYHHSNVDSDEVLFYAGGDFMSRAGAGIEEGSMTYHPAGFVHGPQPGSLEASMDADHTNETAVMIDTFRPLSLSDAARTVSDDNYPWTWSGGR